MDALWRALANLPALRSISIRANSPPFDSDDDEDWLFGFFIDPETRFRSYWAVHGFFEGVSSLTQIRSVSRPPKPLHKKFPLRIEACRRILHLPEKMQW